jgi:dCMP deaminase
MNNHSTNMLYMDLAKRVAQESYCVRQKVGAVIVTESGGLYLGFNGTPSGYANVCELPNGDTDPMVIHAEENALAKMLREGVSANGAVVYMTLSPCNECAKMLHSIGVREIYYGSAYRDTSHFDNYINLGMKFHWMED